MYNIHFCKKPTMTVSPDFAQVWFCVLPWKGPRENHKPLSLTDIFCENPREKKQIWTDCELDSNFDETQKGLHHLLLTNGTY